MLLLELDGARLFVPSSSLEANLGPKEGYKDHTPALFAAGLNVPLCDRLDKLMQPIRVKSKGMGARRAERID